MAASLLAILALLGCVLSSIAVLVLVIAIVLLARPGTRHGPPWDVVVVPGARVYPDGSASPSLQRRIEVAVALVRSGKAERLVVSGRGPGPRTEAEVGATLAVQLGLPEHQVELEDASARTAENARFTAPLLADQRVLVVTDGWHAPRSRLWFRRYHRACDVLGIPSPTSSWLRQAPREAAKLAWQVFERG